MAYDYKKIEEKWQKYWEENKTFKTENDFSKPKYYVLDMFPYPSWAWLHVWHPKGYTANDIIARYKKACWYNVLHPMGWDAFGLPAENYAIKTWTHPKITTEKNIEKFKKQIKSLWFSYDWDREINTTDPNYYKRTQWIFLKLFEHNIAYEQDLPVNYCPSCKTTLANEEVLKDNTCERCWTLVEKRKIRQWVLAITKYADRLEKDVDKLDWPEGIKQMQKNWIWKSIWCEFKMQKADDKNTFISVYTTRIDTVFGMTYAVLAPDHKDVKKFITKEHEKECLNYIEKAKRKSDQDRTQLNKEKTWVFTGSYVINPFNWKKIPLWIWDYVLWNYWTWAVMAVPAHDERDFEFAKKYNLPIIQVIKPKQWEYKEPFTEDWILVNSWEFSGLTSKKAREVLTNYAQEKGFWKQKINYKLRDWLFSRQRYWGEPIPLIHLNEEDLNKLPKITSLDQAKDKNKAYILERPATEEEKKLNHLRKENDKVRELVVNEKVISKIYNGLYSKIIADYNLPVELPETQNYEPAWNWQSPLARIKEFVDVSLADNLTWKRETNTMPQWWGSCWYYLRYIDPHNDNQLVDPEVEKYWWQVDSYVGGAEHAVLHLLYARFWHKFLYDIKVVSHDEPFKRLRNQGLIQAFAYRRKNWGLVPNDMVEEKNWKYFEKWTWEELEQIVSKMSKSLKNVVNPDEIVEKYWSDSLRLYEMYMSDFKDSAPWDTNWIIWVKRFLEKAERLFTSDAKMSDKDDNYTMRLLHKTIKKVQDDIENYKFNTAIAALMILVNNGLPKDEKLQKEFKLIFVRLLHPFAPHLAEELWERLWEKNSIFFASWPKYDENMVEDETITIAVQVMWKLRWTIQIRKDEDKENVIEKAKQQVPKYLDWKQIIKEIYVPWKIVNFVVK